MNISEFIRQGAHTDTFENHRMLAWTEREANIGAADTLIDTEAFLEMSGYESEDVRAYIARRKYHTRFTAARSSMTG